MGFSFALTLFESTLPLRGVHRRTAALGGGQALSYLEAGRRRKGPTLVLVHGLGSSAVTWIRVLGRLAKTHRVIAPDLPGYGRSPPPGGPAASVPRLAEALVAFLRSDIGRGPVVLVGQSMGGWVSVKAAREAPERIEQLVLVNSAGILFHGIEDLRPLLDLKTKAEVLAFWRKLWFRVPWYYRPFWRAAARNLQSASVRQFVASLELPHFVNDDLARLQVPVSIVWGRSDKFLPIETVDTMVDRLGSTRVHWMAKCGHIPPLETPKEFVRVLRGIAGSSPEARPMAPAAVQARGAAAAR